MSVASFISRRVSLNSSKGGLSPAVGVGIAAVALAVLVMTCALAIIRGFKHEISSKISGFNSHITIIPAALSSGSEQNSDAESSILTLTPSLASILESQPYISQYELQVSAPAIFKTREDFRGIYLKSLSSLENRRFVEESLQSGSIPDFSNDSAKNLTLIPSRIADALNLKVGDKIDTYFITDRIIVRPLRIAGIYNSHFNAFDESFAFSSLPLIQEVGNIKSNQATSIVVSVNDFNQLEENSLDLMNSLAEGYTSGKIFRQYSVSNAKQSGAGYFNWLSMLDTNVIVIMTLMTIVAIITIISGMLILMVDKIRLIALLTAMGASRKLISRIFMRLATRIALIGLIIGDILGISLLYIQRTTHFIPLDPDSYYIDFVPVEVSIPELVILNIAVLIIIRIALLLPARFAGKVAPARTLASE